MAISLKRQLMRRCETAFTFSWRERLGGTEQVTGEAQVQGRVLRVRCEIQ
jgi:hypothetical protein